MFLSLSPTMLRAGAAVLILAASFFAGAHYQAQKDEIELLTLKNEMAQQSLKAEAQLQEVTAELQQRAEDAERQGQMGIDAVNDRFNNLVRGLHDELDSLPERAASQGSLQVSDNAADTGNSQESKCRCPRQDPREFRRLQQKLFEVGRDCDIVTNKYNSLLSFVESVYGSVKRAEEEAQADSER